MIEIIIIAYAVSITGGILLQAAGIQ